jgi:hypothetical protein
MAKFIATVVAIVIGVIITRQIVVWIFTFKKYAESILDIDPDQSEDDWEKFKQMLVSSTLGTLITIFIILILTTTPILPALE